MQKAEASLSRECGLQSDELAPVRSGRDTELLSPGWAVMFGSGSVFLQCPNECAPMSAGGTVNADPSHC